MRRAFALFLLLGFPIFAVAQTPSEQAEASQPTPKPRLKIGVAMEGGGALGIAHIGVLQWFEEQHVPVDFIAGTSMGGLVGGFYATGVSPADMKTLDQTAHARSRDRKSTRLNSSHQIISYAVFCFKKKNE